MCMYNISTIATYVYALALILLVLGNIDYSFGPYTVTFIAGNTTASLNISIIDDNVLENNENFFLAISQIFHSYYSSDKVTADTTDRPIVNIIDDDCK